MSFYYKASFQYDGTGYFGFQWQKGIPTVQNDINLALQKLIPGKITTMSASRTDTGVHAFEQFVKITSETEINCATFVSLLNEKLPSQIRCREISPSTISFRPANDSISKEYRYYFTNQMGNNSIERKFIANNPYQLNIEAMQICVKALVGKHDFQNFVSMGSNVKTTIRVIFFCELTRINPQSVFAGSALFAIPPDLVSCYQLRIVGNGFLKQMIRHLMTALWKVGNGRMTVDEFLRLLNGPRKTKVLWKVAHPKGLFLYRIQYPLCDDKSSLSGPNRRGENA